jgi:hypothetical protein
VKDGVAVGAVADRVTVDLVNADCSQPRKWDRRVLIELLTVRRGLGVRRSGVTQRFRIPSRRVWARVSAYGVSYRGTGVN